MKTVNQKKRISNEGGVVLLLSLLLLAALTAAGIGASVVVINEFRTTASTDQGISAYYTANIGMERGLFAIFNNRLAGSRLDEQGLCFSNNSAYCQVKNSQTFPAGFSLGSDRSVSLSDSTANDELKTVSIAKDETLQVDLICGTGQLSPSCGKARTLTLKSSGGPAWAEVQWSYIVKQSVDAGFTSNSTTRLITNTKLTGPDGATLNLESNALFGGDDINPPTGTTPVVNPSDIVGYSVRVKALYGDLANLTVCACQDNVVNSCTNDSSNSCNTVFPIPGDIHLVARGEAANAKARLDATVPWRLPAAGLFDFVVFSESSLDKSN